MVLRDPWGDDASSRIDQGKTLEAAVKLLMFYAHHFWYRTGHKVRDDVPDREGEQECTEAVVVFFHAEAHDVDRMGKVVTKWAKNVKWLARKFGSDTVVLHSFNHLASTKAPLDTAREMLHLVEDRLARTGFSVMVTPFGYQNQWRIHVAEDSLAKVFKEI